MPSPIHPYPERARVCERVDEGVLAICLFIAPFLWLIVLEPHYLAVRHFLVPIVFLLPLLSSVTIPWAAKTWSASNNR